MPCLRRGCRIGSPVLVFASSTCGSPNSCSRIDQSCVTSASQPVPCMRFLSLFRSGLLSAAAFALITGCGGAAETPLTPAASTPAAILPAAGPTSTTTLVISEIMADPATISDANGEWFELHNPGASAVSLTGFQIASLNDASVTITGVVSVPAGGYVVFAKNPDNAVNGGLNMLLAVEAGHDDRDEGWCVIGHGSSWQMEIDYCRVYSF